MQQLALLFQFKTSKCPLMNITTWRVQAAISKPGPTCTVKDVGCPVCSLRSETADSLADEADETVLSYQFNGSDGKMTE